MLVAVSACAPVRIKGNAAMMQAQSARESMLGARHDWTVQARLAVSDGEHGGSGGLTWRQDGDRYRFVLRAPVTGRSFQLQGGPDGAVLEGLDQGPVHDIDAQRLLARVFGWQVPLARLRYWIKGLRVPGAPAVLRFGNNQLPSLLQQDGWTVEYLGWFQGDATPVPRKLFASKGPYRVRIVIEQWNWKLK